ncbi:hypothetical protein AAZX31_12G071900 [Glycine max]
MPFIHSCNSYILQLFTCIIYWEIPKSHIGCLNPWSAAYISVGQLHLMPIDFKMKSNMVSEQVLTLGPRLRFCCDEYPPFVVHAPSPINTGREGGVLGNTQVTHRLPQSLECGLYICWTTSLNANWF